MFVGTITLDLLFGDVHSLKEKRSLLRPILADLQRKNAVAASEVEYQDLHRRSRIGIAVVSATVDRCADVLDECERQVAGRPEIQLLSTRRRVFGEDD
ncbi:MAG TPA: DUF503 domain-containing protein [Yinghuangia sp.]|uniref:DUF503 domain-containing protein n=1 Tax=Yinghuangia sp. YIM S10712 TaxID=3436930 RepID=UPI002BE1E979|nr:DUF503 domain-containing protein [Yinghuangia sp.]